MLSVYIAQAKEWKTITIRITGYDKMDVFKTELLGASGEHLRTFQLSAGDSEVRLNEFTSGTYTLRVEVGSEVVVQQISIP